MTEKNLLPKKEREARLIYYSKILRDAYVNNHENLEQAIKDFIDSVEVYDRGES